MDTTISAGGYQAVVTDAGGGLRSLTHEGTPLLKGVGPGEVPAGASGQLLVPWPNRIRDGVYTFGDTEQHLTLSEPSRHNASHGLVRWCRWQVAETTEDAVRMEYSLVPQSGYPWSLDVLISYAVSPSGLAVTVAATNRSDSPAPFAAGMHPYLDVGCPVDQATLALPGSTRQLVDDRLLPTGTEPVADPYDFRSGRSVGALELDDAFTDLERDADGLVVVRLEGRWAVEMWQDRSWPWLQVFSGDTLAPEARRQSMAVEPMSAPADAFNSGRDLVVLGPDESWSGTFGIRAG